MRRNVSSRICEPALSARSSRTSRRCSTRCANRLVDLLAPCAQPLQDRPTASAVRHSRRRRQRLRQDDDYRQARATPYDAGTEGDARRGRHFPRRRDRAAEIWGGRNSVPVIAQQTGADPAAVIFDALQAARARGIDVLIADTAGRLQTQSHLMDELKKVKRVIRRLDRELRRTRSCSCSTRVSGPECARAGRAVQSRRSASRGSSLTKLDGTAKGGVVIAIAERLKLPIRLHRHRRKGRRFRAYSTRRPFVDALLAALGRVAGA